MKEPLEELFKKSLEGHEMSYRPEAWNAMRSRLDAISPIAAPRSYTRYYIAAAGISIVAVASYFIFTHENTPEPTTQTQIVQNETTKSESTSSESTVSTENGTTVDNSSTESTTTTTTTTTTTPENTSASTTNVATAVTTNQGTTTGTTNIQVTNNTAVQGTNQTGTQNVTNTTGTVNTASANPTPTGKQMVVPVIPDLCMNERIRIDNTNDRMIMVLSPDGTITAIQAGKVISYQAKMEGMHGIGYLENEDFYSESTFSVQLAPEADFSIDNVNKFESGIPTTHVVAGSSSDTYTWKANNQVVTGSEADLHFYKKGKQTILLTVSNEVCSSTTKKTIFVEEDYNLMAVNSFRPLSNDSRLMTFMPFALTQRDVNFNLVIIDSKDGGVVYETSDSDQPWDGTDMRSGERDRGITTYIWKVMVYNPEINEPAEYIGTVTKL